VKRITENPRKRSCRLSGILPVFGRVCVCSVGKLILEYFHKKKYYKNKAVMDLDVNLTGYITVRNAAQAWGITERMVVIHIARGRVPGAVKIGNLWLIPKEAVKPPDGRVNNRRRNTAPKQSGKEDT